MPAPYVQRHEAKSTRGYAPSFFAGDHRARISVEHDACERLVPIRGKLEPADHLKLYECAYYASGPILEIGRLEGRSTAVLALGSRAAAHGHPITSVDLHERYAPIARRHLRALGLDDDRPRIDLLSGDSSRMVAMMPPRSFDVVFIDGDHTYEGVRRDCAALAAAVAPGATLLFHDYYHPANTTGEYGVQRAVDEFRPQAALSFRGRFGGIAMFEFGGCDRQR